MSPYDPNFLPLPASAVGDVATLAHRLNVAASLARRLRDDDELLPAERALMGSTLRSLTHWSDQTARKVADRLCDGFDF